MAKRVLSVGQCAADHYGIMQYLRQHFGAEVVAADRERETLQRLRTGRFDLVLVNRKLDMTAATAWASCGRSKQTLPSPRRP